MKRIGVVSYNIYSNFTNYGSALQSWAINRKINQLGYYAMLVDYCPEILKDKDPLNPVKNMWDQDEISRKMCELSMPAIEKNYYKFDRFYHEQFNRTNKYTADNFNEIVRKDKIDGFVCGSDTIFCIDEFGFDDGYYANYECMKKNTVSYATSFGDSHFDDESYAILNNRLRNFNALGLRENQMVPYVKSVTDVKVQRTIDPTLLLTDKDYDTIIADKLVNEKYLLLYVRRYNPQMEAYAEQLASKHGWKIVEISLRATNADKENRIMLYEAGVEEFLSLVKHAEFVVTNSYHGMIFAVQYRRYFNVFSREQCDTKIIELLELLGLSDRLIKCTNEADNDTVIDYDSVYKRLESARKQSLEFLSLELEKYL